MIQGFYTAKTGVANYQNFLNVTANNIANASTVAYKSQRVAFSDLVYTDMPKTIDLQSGNGTKVSSVSADLTQGVVTETDNALDVAIYGDGYFCVENEAGERYYTRAGNFQVSESDGQNYLVTANGERVLDRDFNPIIVTGDVDSAVLSGPSQANDGEEGTIQLAVVRFDNPYALKEEGNGLYSANAQSGQGTLVEDAVVVQGGLESSNVDLATEMTKMIQAQRGFQFSSRVIQTADELESMANTLRG